MSKSSSERPSVYPTRSLVSHDERGRLLGQRGTVIWLTGLSGSGKSTLANGLEKALIDAKHGAFVLDGDTVRAGLNRDLTFSPHDRKENIRRLAAVAALFADAGILTITAFISPYRADREQARASIGPGRFLEVFVDAPQDVCRQRDPKGLYAQAEGGSLAEFTGVSAPYEAPQHPDLHLFSAEHSVAQCVAALVQLLKDRGVFADP